ncbi:hypothetical protein [uncultured Maricaulis sp.]|uniref:hypothetical protein n=1 Tax=uncultured Maricaulis sp. TaxID=174710 RepID=UPI0030DA837F|tara:strand:+ start:105192 stop:106457 length:1266 start_codon:yes stop_codon:yes gene_type:complete
MRLGTLFLTISGYPALARDIFNAWFGRLVKPIALCLMLLAPSGGAGALDWPEIDFWAVGIAEPECRSSSPPFPKLCEIRHLSQADLDEITNELFAAASNGEYLSTLSDGILTISSLSAERESFVCCDIQGPFRAHENSDGQPISVARFGVPAGAFIHIELMNDVDMIGSGYILESISDYQKAYIGSQESQIDVDYQTIRFDSLDRDVHVFQNRPDLPPKHIFYVKDGNNAPHVFAPALLEYYGGTLSEMPSFALIGIESGSSDVRLNEYVRAMSNDTAAYDRYRSIFEDAIVPQIEEMLGYTGGAAGRVLFGQSNGGRWVLDYSLDHPSFACSIMAMSIAGGNLEQSEVAEASSATDCRNYYLAAGQLEGSMLARTEDMHHMLLAAGLSSQLVIEAGGHNFSSWVPAFLFFFDQIMTSASD